jgi:uncharacterized secreted protein with C-terminal beta-propeller domain
VNFQAFGPVALSDQEVKILDLLKPGMAAKNGNSLSTYIKKIAQLGGYLARFHDPPPGNMVIWRVITRLSEVQLPRALSCQGERRALNRLYVLEQVGNELRPAAPLQDFAPVEDIRSVRHVGATAYIVTFKKTDPLFAFDLCQLRDPKMLGELKIPGFSTNMHPLADDRLLGVGFDAIDQ